jgi:hypothetical protein
VLNLKKGFICQENKRKKEHTSKPKQPQGTAKGGLKICRPGSDTFAWVPIDRDPPNRRKKTQVFLAKL